MTNLRELELGVDGVAYVEECLRQAEGLSSELLAMPLASGKAYALIPEHTSEDRAKAFNQGGSMSRHDANVWLVSRLQKLWDAEGAGTLVIHDVWAKPSDRAAQRTRAKKFFDNENVYYFLERENGNIFSLETTIGAVVSYLFVGVFTRLVIRNADLSPDHTVGQQFIEQLARSAIEIFVSAYDQEGLVI